MDPRDPSQRPSIFTKPEPIEERPAAPQEEPSDFWRDSPVPRRAVDSGRFVQPGPSRRLMIGLAVGGVVLLAVGGFVASVLMAPADDAIAASSQSASASATATPSITPTPTAEPSAAASPTPVPTPAGPPQEIPVGAWATVAVDELNVRAAAGTDSTSNYLLVRGAVMHVAEGPVVVADLNWYRIASLGGATGWVTSGWVAEPFVTTLVEDPTLIRCGDIGHPVFDVVDGVPTPHDPIAIGDLALPAAAFSEEALGAMELMRGVGTEACFSAEIGSDGLPAITAQLSVSACGHAAADGNFYRMRPAAMQNMSADSLIKDPAIVAPALLVGGPPEDRKSSNIRSVFRLIAADPDATGCMYLSVTDGAGSVEAIRSVDTTQCSVVHEYTKGNIKLSLASGSDTVWIKLTEQAWQPGIFPLEVPVPVTISASATADVRDAYAYQGYDPDCR